MAKIRLLPPAGTRASLAIDGPASASFNTVIEAVLAYEGPAGNQISLETVADADWEACAGTLTLGGVPVADETVTIGTTVYTWKADPTTVAFEVEIGADADISCTNLIAAINLTAGAGTIYGSATTEHPTVRAFRGAGDTIIAHSRPEVLAAAGTLIATTSTTTLGTWAAATLADGVDGDNVVFTVTDTAISCSYADGFSCVEDFEAAIAADAAVAALIQVKTAGTSPLYQLVVTDDDFAATNLTGGGSGTVAAPTLDSATAGVAIGFNCDQALVLVRNVDTATGTTKTATPILWGYVGEHGYWYSLGTLNNGNAIGETTSDAINYAEVVTGLRGVTRLAAQSAVGGAGTEVEIVVIPCRAETVTS